MTHKLFVAILICLIMSFCDADMTTMKPTTTQSSTGSNKREKLNILELSLTTIGHMEDLFVDNHVINKYITKIFKEIYALADSPNISKMSTRDVLIHISRIPNDIEQSGYLETERMNAYREFDFIRNKNY